MKDSRIPDWLRREDDYRPAAGQEGLLEKNILSFLAAVAGTRERPPRGGHGTAGEASPGLKLATALAVILLVSLSRAPAFLAAVGTLELVLVSLLDARSIARILRTSLAAFLFAAAVFLPAAIRGNAASTAFLLARILASVTAAGLVSATTAWPDLSRGLAALRLPGLFILVLDLAVKYIALLGGLTLDMLAALKLRSVGGSRDSGKHLAAIAGTVFLRSKEAASEMYAAMECRGFSGSYGKGPRRRPGTRDAACAALLAAVAALFLVLGEPL